MKKSIITALSILLTVLILAQTMSIAAFAIDDDTEERITYETIESSEPTNSISDMPDIVCEVDSKRNACKKDYLLEDGSFCSVITASPIHEYCNGRWIEKNKSAKAKTIEQVVNALKTSNNSRISESEQTSTRGDNTYSESNGLIIDWADNSYSVENSTLWHTLDGDETAFYVKPAQVDQYTANGCIVKSAVFSLNCELSGTDADTYIYGVDTWSNNYENMTISDTVYSIVKINTDSTYAYDITHLFNKWERGKEANTGFAYLDANTSNISVSNPCLVINYIDTASHSLDCTYHSVNLGSAGIIYINDVTNCFTLKQKILNYSYNDKTDLSIYRTYDSTDAGINNLSGIKSTFNFESVLNVNPDYAEWTMFDGNTVSFIPSNPLVSSDGYEVWNLLPSANSANLNALLYLPATENSSLAPYTLINGLEYWFDDGGCIDRIVSVPSNDNIMSFTYEDLYIEILLQDGNKYRIEKNNPNNSFVSAVKLLDATNNPVIDENNIEKKTIFSFVENNNQMTNTVTFYNGDSSVYVFDAEGHLLYVSSTANNSSIRCEFEYAEYPDQSLGSYITGYELFNNNSNTAYESLEIDSDNTFKRVFTDISGKEENIYYDSNYRIVTYVGKNAIRKCIDYDENGILSSYVFDDPNYYGENNDAELLNSNDFPNKNLSPWTRLTNYNGDSGNLASSSNIKRVSNPHGRTGNGVLFGLTIDNIFDISLYRDVPNTIFEADKTYVFGGEVYLDEVLSDLSKTVSISIEIAPVLNGIPSTNYTEYSKITFDNTLLNEWQYRRKAFKLEDDSVIRFKLNYSNQGGQVYFMMPTLFESSDSITDLDDLVTSSPIEYTYSNGKTTSETMIWERLNDTDLTMSTAYSYTQNGKLREYEDFNGNPTYYQYDSNGFLSGKGHSVDGLGNITDVNSLVYDAESVLTSTTQIIQNVENNNNVTLSTGYDEYRVSSNDFDITYVKIHHNGYAQVFKYDSEDGGMLTETYAESTSLPNDRTNYKTKYQYDTNKDIAQIDYSNGYRDKFYEADYPDEYNYKCISRYSVDGVMETLEKTYTYQFDDDGNLLKSYDDSTNIMVDYTNNGYSLYEYDNTDPVLIFSDTKDTENTVRTYSNTYYDLQYPTATPTDTVEISPSTISFNSDGIKTTSSTTVAEKNIGIYRASADYNMFSIEDYFGRLKSKEAYIEHRTRNNISGTMSLNEDYEYKDLGNGKTSGLVSEYTSTLTGSCTRPDENNNNAPTLFNINNTYSRKYEYDNRGNITFVYTEDNNTIVPKEYYEYDNANQIVTEINFENQVSAHYTYDAGGNLTAKIYYDYEDLVFNISTREITTLGDEVDRITYQYDSVWKDRLINYDGTTITYDKMGNPLNYIGTNNQGIEIEGTLEWSGNLLTAFESDEIRIEYQYDRNGFRTQKIVYNKSELNNNTVYNVNSVSDYIWDNGTLNGIIMSDIDSTTGHRKELLNVSFIYDESGSPIGYMSLLGIPYLFKKDIHDSVLSLVFPDGEEMFTYSYDSWGNVTTTYSENWSQDEIQFLIVYVMAALCPIAYHGYLYDYDTGMCFNKGRCYSPDWGRNLNPEDYEKLLDRPENPLEANLYLFCDNNPLNVLDKTASWYKEYRGVEWKSNGFEVAMSDMFASRPLCTIFASQVIKEHGTWDATKGYNYIGLNAEDIACDLFAHYVGKYAKAAINKVNAVWGDGWILNNSKSDMIFVYKEDPNLNNPNNPNEYGKYYKIWIAAPEIKVYAQKEGIFITL